MLNDDFPEMTGTSCSPKSLGGSSVTIHLSVPDVDQVFSQAVSAGAQVTMPLADMYWGDRFGKLRDPFGHDWSLSMPQKKPTEAEIQAGTQKYFGNSSK